MNTFTQNMWLKSSQSNFSGSLVQKTLAGLMKESTETSDIEAYQSLLRTVIERVGQTSIIPMITSVIPATTPQGKVPVMNNVVVGAKDTVKTGNIKIFTVADSSSFVVDGPVTSATAIGNVLYIEDNKLLVDITSGIFAVSDAIDNADPFVTGATTITGIYTNVIGVGTMFSNYTGPYSTSDAEKLTGATAKEIQIKVNLADFNVKEKKAFTGLTIEFIQDMQYMYGEEAVQKIIDILTNSMEQEIEQQFFKYLKTIATQKPDLQLSLSYGTQSALGTGGVFEDILASIMKSTGKISTDTSFGGDYFVIASSNVCAALQHITKVYKKPEFSALNSNYIGHLLNSDIVLIGDNYSMVDYILVGCSGPKGADNSGTIFVPYTVDFINVTDPDTFETKIAVMNRYDMIRSPLDTKTANGSSDFYHMQVVDFSNLTNYDKI